MGPRRAMAAKASPSQLSLDDLTMASQVSTISCENDLVPVLTIDALSLKNGLTVNRKIPAIVHQTAKSRCVTQKVHGATQKWHFAGYQYYFHDDEAVTRLFQREFPEFPHLGLISSRCLQHGTLRADLWRYLVLWVYGGIYADVDSAPAAFDPYASISDNDDALFVVEQYHLLSQWFMAVSPRHPLMFYAIQISLWNLLAAPDTGSISAAMYTGPHALHAAYIQFRKDAGAMVDTATKGNKPVWSGHFVGTFNRSVTVLGEASNQNKYVNRDVLGGKKKRQYEKMGMRHFQDDKKFASGMSCTRAILEGHNTDKD